MASVDDWSDSEIRSKLAELGTPVGPVTETTRKTLIKKLKKLITASESTATTPGRTRRSLSRFSSGDEDSQEDAPSMPPPSRTRTLRRRTVGPTDVASMNDSATQSPRDSGTTSNKSLTKTGRKSTSMISTPAREDFDSGSDSDAPAKTFESNISGRRSLKTEIPLPSRAPDSSSSRTSIKPDSASSRVFTSSITAPELSSSSPSRTYSNFRSETTTTKTRQYVVPPSEATRSSFLSSVRSDLDRGGSSTTGGSTYREVPSTRTTILPPAGSSSRVYEKISTDYRKTYQEEQDEEEDEQESGTGTSGFQSDFLSRLQGKNRASGGFKPLSSLSRDNPSTVYSYSRSSISPARTAETPSIQLFDKYKNIDFGGYRNRISAATRDLFSSSKNLDHPERLHPSKSFASRICSRNLMYVLLFVVLALISGLFYMNMGPNFLGLESDDNSYPICDEKNSTQPCIENKDLQPALNLLRIIQPKLHELAIDAYCQTEPGEKINISEVPYMTETAAVEYLIKKVKPIPKSYVVEQDLRHLKILILANPHWDVKVINEADEKDVKKLLVTAGLAAQNIHYPLTCVIYRFVYGIARWVVITGSVFGILALGLYCYRFYKKRQEQHRRDVYSMVNKVLTMLATHYEKDKQGYLAVDNCRDELIQPIYRDSMKTVWDAAVDFIEKHESRVRTELHNVRGENVKVWRWLPAKGPPMSDAPKLDRLM